MSPAPRLVLAVGNPARGDDGAGPWLAERLRALALPGLEVLEDYQLQVEHALDLAGREAVLFIDAAREASLPGAAASTSGLALWPLQPALALPALSHALTPAGVLHVAQRLGQALPRCWMLAVQGEQFGLGEAFSPAMRQRLPAALQRAQAWAQGPAGAWAILKE